jgi:hypothetical protein
MNPFRAPAVAALALLLAACSAVTEPHADGTLVARATPPYLRIENVGTSPVYYAVFEASLAARILWAPCDRPKECPRVDPGGELRIRYPEIPGYDEAERPVALLYWWHLVPRGRGFEPDSVRVIPVPL